MQLDTRADKAKNRYYLRASGKPTIDDVRALKARVAREVGSLAAGYTVLSELEGITASDEATQAELVEVLKVLSGNGRMKALARVVTNGATGGMQIDRLAKTGAGYVAKQFPSASEADAFLDTVGA